MKLATLCFENWTEISHFGISWTCFLYLLQLEILDSKLLKDFVPAGVALQIDSTVRAGDHLWRVNLHLDDNFSFRGILSGTISHLGGPYSCLSHNIAFARGFWRAISLLCMLNYDVEAPLEGGKPHTTGLPLDTDKRIWSLLDNIA